MSNIGETKNMTESTRITCRDLECSLDGALSRLSKLNQVAADAVTRLNGPFPASDPSKAVEEPQAWPEAMSARLGYLHEQISEIESHMAQISQFLCSEGPEL